MAGDWSPCSTSCGPGIRTRSVRCKIYLPAFDSLFDLNDLDCQGSHRPQDVEECQMPTCTPLQSSSMAQVPMVPTEPNAVPHPDPTNSLELVDPVGPDILTATWRYDTYTPCSASCVGGRSTFAEGLLLMKQKVEFFRKLYPSCGNCM